MNKAEQTANHVQLLHVTGSKLRRQRIPRQVYPKLIEVAYAQALVTHIGHAKNALTPLVHAIPHLLPAAQAARQDADESKQVQHLLELARGQLNSATSPSAVENLARQFGIRTIAFNRVQLGRQVRAALGADALRDSPALKAVLDHYVTENVALIKSIPAQVIDQVEGLVHRAFSSGEHVDTLQDAIEDRFSVGESRARLIARDQIGKLYGQTNKVRQVSLGVTKYEWQTAGDERVRPEHEELNGRTFSWDDPPDEGNPGEAIQCRCSAQPIFTDILDALDDSET